MATSSKFVLLSSSVLMEYIYADQSAINVSGNEYRISTSIAPIWLMQNAHTNITQVLNSDSSSTANIRNHSYAQLQSYEVALLDIDKLVFYNDYDSDLTSSNDLPIVFTNPQSPVYDTIRVHLVQGFNFENNEGFVLSVKAKRKDASDIILANIVYNSVDSWRTLDPSPFYFAGRIYDSYVEFKVLSLYNLIYDYWLGTLTGDTVVERITENVGIARDQYISTSFSWVRDRSVIDEQDYLTLYDTIEIDLPTQDQFQTIAAVIQESNSGDYVEFYGTFNGNIIENFILDINNSGEDYIVLHDLTIFEYVYNLTNSTYSWIQTDSLQISQTDGFDEPNLYRPIIKNSSAIAYKIDYVMRLYNRNDNTQIWKTASMTSYSAAKYGRKLLSLNLGTNPIQSKIYNQNVIKDIQINRIVEPVLNTTKYITSFITSNQIAVSFQSINLSQDKFSTVPQETGKLLQANSNSNAQIYDNGLGKIVIPNSTSYLKFTIYQKKDNQNSPLNLSGIGSFILSFDNNNNDPINVIEYPDSSVNKGFGEVVFRITETEAKKILNLKSQTFFIYNLNEKGEKTYLYSGKFYSVTDYQNVISTDKILIYESQIAELTNLINNLNIVIANQQSTITTMTANTQTDVQQVIQTLNDNVATINQSVDSSINALQNANGLPVKPLTSPVKPSTEPVKTPSYDELLLNQNKSEIQSSPVSSYLGQTGLNKK